jgi:hypothetical protein
VLVKQKLLPKEHFAAIGAIAVHWSIVELHMELMILGLYEIDMGRGLVLTNNLSFHSRMSLLRILANDGTPALMSKKHSDELKALLNRAETAFNERNTIVHGVWSPTEKPGVVRRMAIRARGKKLQTVQEDYSAVDLRAIDDRVQSIIDDFDDLSSRMDVGARLALAPKHSSTTKVR